MYKIAILGCENSHADAFIECIKTNPCYSDVELLGVYTNEPEAEDRMKEKYGVYCAKSYDEFVGKLDGVIITARDGANHYKYAKPYIDSGIPMFIDKPITCDEDEALMLAKELKSHGCRVTGGSSCVHAPLVVELASYVREEKLGKVYGGFLRAPVSLNNAYSGFYFYAQHLVQVTEAIFGFSPVAVTAHQSGDAVNVLLEYEKYDVTMQFVDGNYEYYASLSAEGGVKGDKYPVTADLYPVEFEAFYNLLCGGEQRVSYEEFIAPVYLISAIDRSMKSGKREVVLRVGEV